MTGPPEGKVNHDGHAQTLRTMGSTMEKTVRCFSCNGSDRLHLVTGGLGPLGPDPKRILVYCGRCRDSPSAPYDLSIPLGFVTPEMFVNLYERGYSESSP